MPLASGNSWSYSVRWGLQQRVDEVAVVGRISVAGRSGWLLEGPLGVSRLAWIDGTLLAEELGGIRYAPAIPLASIPLADRQVAWQGLASVDGQLVDASAKLLQRKAKVQFGGRTYPGLANTLSLQAGGHLIEMESHFVPGVGIVRQDQRIDGRLERALELLSGP